MRGGDNRPRETRVNERIRAREIRVIDEEGQMLGVMSPTAALALARERNLDLVEVSPMAVPPVCKILDWGRYKYEQSKKESDARKHQKVTQLKEIRMRPRTDDHDVDVKVRKIQEFLSDGDKVKVSVTFRGREMAHPELGRALLEQVVEALKGTATIERPPIMEGKMISMIVSRGAGSESARRAATDGQAARPQRAASAEAATEAATDAATSAQPRPAESAPPITPASAQQSERAPAPTAQ